MAIILGIDPGSRVTGFGIIEATRSQQNYIASGHISLPMKEFSLKLKKLFDEINLIIKEYAPHEAAIERVFMHANVSSALKLGHARGAIMVALGNNKLPIAEYSPRQIKQAAVGYGAANKSQIQHMVKSLLRVHGEISADAADALAIAICHANSRKMHQLCKLGVKDDR